MRLNGENHTKMIHTLINPYPARDPRKLGFFLVLALAAIGGGCRHTDPLASSRQETLPPTQIPELAVKAAELQAFEFDELPLHREFAPRVPTTLPEKIHFALEQGMWGDHAVASGFFEKYSRGVESEDHELNLALLYAAANEALMARQLERFFALIEKAEALENEYQRHRRPEAVEALFRIREILKTTQAARLRLASKS